MMSVFRVLSFCYLIRVAISQVEVQTSVTPLQSSSASFQYPRATESLTVNVVDTIVVEWKSNFPQNAFLYLWCDNGVPGAPNNRKWTDSQVNTTGTTKISPTFYVDKVTQDWTRPYACHLDLTYEDEYFKGVTGPSFNVTSVSNQGITRTYAYLNTIPPISPRELSSTTSMSNSITALSSPTSLPSSDNNNKNNDADLSTGATAGIATGAIIGSIVLAVLGFVVWRRRKVDKRASMGGGDNVSSMHQDQVDQLQSQYKELNGHQNTPAELEPQGKPHELPAS